MNDSAHTTSCKPVLTMASLQLKNGLLQILFIFFIFINLVKCQGTCQPHGIRKVSEGTSGFPTVFHIEVLEDQTDLHNHDSRQVLIPAMNFNCSGNITKWIIPANWEDDGYSYPELQLWKRITTFDNSYLKVGATTIQVASENTSRLYEITVDPPLEFDKDDIIGYFQPDDDNAQLDIYLENSRRITTHRDNLPESQTQPPTSVIFDLDSADTTGVEYPLIAVETDPPNCGCGVLTVGRITTLLNRNRNDFGFRTVFPQEQSIFPNIQFTEHGKVVRWVMGGSNIILSRTSFPELQIWRPMGGNTYKKLNGTTVSTLVQLTTGVYELAVANPLPFQPGDILGLFQPPLLRSILSIHYDSSNHAENYYLPLSEITMEPTHTFIDVNMGDWKIGHVLPLVSVEIVLDITSSKITTSSVPNIVTTPTPPLLTTTPILSNPVVTPYLDITPTTLTTKSRQMTQNVTTIPVENTPLPTDQASLQADQTPQQTNQPPLQTDQTPQQTYQPPLQTDQAPVQTNQPPLQTDQAPVQTNQPPLQTDQAPVQTSSVPVSVNTASSISDDNEQNLMFYVSIGVVVTLLVLILVLVIVLIIILLSPRKDAHKSDTAHNITLEPSGGTHYELYTDTRTDGNDVTIGTDGNDVISSFSPINSDNVFDDPIYNEPNTQQDSSCNLLDIGKLYSIQPTDDYTPAVQAYAISNVHASADSALTTSNDHDNDYDYADP